MKELLKISIRQEAIFLPAATMNAQNVASSETTVLITRMAELGYGVSERLLHALNNTPVNIQNEISEILQEITGINKNWTPLVREWNLPTGESFIDHLATFFANLFKAKGTKLDCGHIIPEGTFPLERYNGCPFCGTPFSIEKLALRKQGSHLKVLDLWTETDIDDFFNNLLSSKTALDATQADSLKMLLNDRPLPDCEIPMKETLMLVAETLMSTNRYDEVQKYFHTPNDILRFLWYRKTGLLQIVSPKTILSRKVVNKKIFRQVANQSAIEKLKEKESLKLKYSRRESIAVAKWMNELNISAEAMCENMHPKRDMWVRFIRSLRLAEYGRRKDFHKLAEMLDRFYKEDYTVLEGKLNAYRMKYDIDNALALLQSRPGLFSRSLFANMLWFGSAPVVEAFEEIIEKVPARLLLTLQMYAADYFDKENKRIVRPLGNIRKTIPSNKLVALYDEAALEKMQEAVAQLCLEAIKRRFSNVITNSKTIYIDEQLYNIPLSIGERSNTLQDVSSALTGTKFKVEGDCVRIFMQWGIGLSAQHMDMDLSCQIVYDDKTHYCSFSSLTPIGCKHSGDIRSIPENVGTAEYIEVDIATLRKANARFVAFGCNAYSAGALSPNMVVGWMNSKNYMHISETSGVAYDPSCVQHQVRITNGLQKGLLFGVLDVEQSTITWLELDFHGQIIQQIDHKTIPLMLKKLNSRISVGQLLEIKAIAQGLQTINTEKADEVYSLNWAKDSAAVTKLFID